MSEKSPVETRGRKRHIATPYQLTEAHELTLLDRFLQIPRFRDVVWRNYSREEAIATVIG